MAVAGEGVLIGCLILFFGVVVGLFGIMRLASWAVFVHGVILLAGIVVNNAIILVDTTNRLRRDGMAKLEAL